MAMTAARPVIRGVVFDMDGTLTVPCIDFALMKQRAGVPQDKDILDTINGWEDVACRERAFAAILEMEEDALANMRVMPGCTELCAFLDAQQVPRGLITRNVRAGVRHFHDFHLVPSGARAFEPAITRECDFEYKPSPAALVHICKAWGVAPGEAVMIGDSVKDDIVCGNRAGAVTILLDYDGKNGYSADQFEGEMRPTHVVTGLSQVEGILRGMYELRAAAHGHNVIVPGSNE
ncbi:hypothetical protein FOA52_012180 [Chlamydomonas sp. UWO 241]|nr:hypothetical protein FOA52_012180 [Chlamydomonas sp. UWO 241]